MQVAYVAHTQSSTLMLDADGVCLRVEARGMPATTDGARRCVGAQYVASLDLTAAGGLAPLPKIGSPMMFAAVGGNGKIYLVRTGPLLAFEEVFSSVQERAPATRGYVPQTPPPPAPRVQYDYPPRQEYDYPPRQSYASHTDDPTRDYPTRDYPTYERQDYAQGYAGNAFDHPEDDDTATRPFQKSHTRSKPYRPLYVPPPMPDAPPYPPPMPAPSVMRSTIPPPSPFGRPRRISTPPPPPPRPIPITRVPQPVPSSTAATPIRRRAPAPSSHAWLRDSPAAVAMWRVK